MSESYGDLIREAETALRRLLLRTDVGSGLILRSAYNELKRASARETRRQMDAAAAATERIRQEEAEWRNMPWYERERHALEVLGDRSLTVLQLMHALREHLPDAFVSESAARGLLYRLLAAGEVDRRGEPYGRRVRYRYYRRTDLQGPIADLERTFEEGSDDA